MGWTDERIARLSELWGTGKSASEIAEILGGVTRNAVIGKAHRLGLSGRPSPIKRREAPPAPVVEPTGTTILSLTERMCRWPIGDPRNPGFRFCGRSILPGHSYCAEHAAQAYQAPKSRRVSSEDTRTARA
ncbi:MAG: global cell cycle regulator GcrA-like protein [Rhodospirillaceae bacterium]|nr:global cell cycle regulator GcrA-like protein [Rhodospirillaceae bacterium]